MSTPRREFLRTAAAASSVTFIPSWLRAGIKGYSPNAQLNIGVIGTGKQANGLANRLIGMEEARIVAGCDVYGAKLQYFTKSVSEKYAEKGGSSRQEIKEYKDYRDLIAHPGLDVVLIATPDHQHAAMCIAALERGLHVYCEKPLAHTIEEGRAIVEATDKSGKVLQTGSMQRSMRPFRKAVELIQKGALGELQEAIVSIGPPPKVYDLPEESLPASLDWEAWVGPSVTRPYNHLVAPAIGQNHWAKWRDYAEYGGGMVTDWGAHMFDIVQWALGKDDSGPVQFFPPGGENPRQGLTMFYEDGFRVEHRNFGRGNAIRFIGSEGAIEVARGFIDCSIPGLVGYQDTNQASKVSSNVIHFRDFFDAIKQGSLPVCPAETGHRSSSVCTLTNIAYRLRRPIMWDPKTEKIQGDRAANNLLGPAYRNTLA